MSRVPTRPAPGRPARPRARGARALARRTRPSTRPSTLSARPPALDLLRGPAHRQRPPGTHHVEARVFKDVFPRFKTMQGYHVERKAGWDCHGLPVELAVEKELGFSGKSDIEAYGVAEFNARCRESVLRHVDAFEEMTERMGYWVDTDRGLPHDGPLLRRVGLVGAQADPRQGPAGRGLPRRAVLPALRHRAVRPRAGPGLRDGRPTRQRLRPVPAHLRPVRRPRRAAGVDHHARGRWCPTPPSRSHPDVTYVVATDGAETLVVAEPLFGTVLGEGWTVHGHGAPARTWSAGPTSALRAGRVPADEPAGTRALRGARRLRHHRGRHRPGAPVPRVRRGRHGGRAAPTACRSWTRCAPTARSATTCRWSAGSSSSTPTPTWSQDLEARGLLFRAPRLRAQLPALLALPHARCCTTRSRPGTSAPPQVKDALLRENEKTAGTPTRSSGAATATGCTTTSTGRCRAAATGARRCRCGAAPRATRPASARWPSCPS